MFRNEFDDNMSEHTDLTQLIEQFERCLENQEQAFFDEDALEQIMDYYELQMETVKLEKAVDFAIVQNPYSSDFLIRKAEILLNRKKYSEAHLWLDKAMLFDATEIDIYLVRADIFMETNSFQEALDILNTALNFADESEKEFVYAEMSHAFELMEDYEKALECLIIAVRYNPENASAMEELAHLIDMTDEYDKSIELHKGLIEKSPYHWMAWYNLGRAYAGLGLYEKAIDAYDYCLAIHEDFEYAYRESADACFRNDDLKKAIELFESAQQHSAGYDDYSFRIGICFEKLEDYKQARFHYRKATRTDPYHDESFFRIGETYRIEGRFDAALVNYKKAIKLDEQNEYYLTTIIAMYQNLDHAEEAVSYMYTLVYAKPDVLTYWTDLIQNLYSFSLYTEALEVCEEALHRCGNFSEFFYLQAMALYKNGEEKDAITKLEYALHADYPRNKIMIETDEAFYFKPEVQSLMELYKK